MAGLNHIREAYEQVYAQLDERMDPEERALRRAEVADKKASRMDPKVAAKYASSEAQSAARADKKSRGKHIHGMADSYEVEGELVDEKFVKAQNPSTGRKSLPDRQSYKGTETEPFRGSDSRSLRHEIARSSGTSKKPKNEGRDYLGRDHGGSEEEHQSNVRFGKRMAELQGSITSQGKSKEKTSEKKLKEAKDDSYLETDMKNRQSNNEKAIAAMKKTKGYVDMVKAARKHFDEAFVDPEHGEAPSGRTPLQNVSDHPKASVRKKAVKAFKSQMGKEYGGTWKSRTKDPVAEAVYGGEKKEPEDKRMTVTAADQKGNTPAWKRYQAGHPGYKAAPHLTKEEMILHLQERALDAVEKKEKESVYKAIKPSKLAKTYPEKSPEELKRLRYAISTAQAKKSMDTSRSDKRYGKEA